MARPAARPRDAIALLLGDHAKARRLLERFASARSAAVRARLLVTIRAELEAHMAVEEEIFYPAYLEAVRSKEDRRQAFEAREEHALARRVLGELETAAPGGESFAAKAKVLKDLVEHHAEEEEEEMFPTARRALSRDALRDLGRRMEERKDAFRAARGESPPTGSRSVA